MAIGHGELMHSVFPNTRAWEQQEQNKTKETDEDSKKSMERSKVETNKKEVQTAYHILTKIQ